LGKGGEEFSGYEAIMQDDNAVECPMPEPFRAKIGLTVFLAFLFYQGFLTRVMFAPLMPAIETEIGLTHAQAGGLFLMISIGFLLSPLFSGLLSSKINHRGTLIVSAWTIGLVLIPFALVNSIWAIRGLLVIIGLAAGIHGPSAIATITAEIRKQDWGKALSVHQSAPPLSFVTAPLIAAVLLNFFTWRIVLIIGGFVGIGLATAYSLKGKGGDFPGQLPSLPNIKIILGKPSFYLMVLLFAMAMGGNAGIFAMLPLFLVNEHGFTIEKANTLIGFSQVAGWLMVYAAGMITDRVGQKATMAAVLLTAGITTLLIGLLDRGWLIVAIFAQPILVNSFFPGAFGALSRIVPPHLRSVTNALGPPFAFLIGGGILPAVIGYMGETYTFAAGIMLAGAFMLLGPALVYFLKLGQYDDQTGC
jgi:NNP family nitrate/nitrite transporter-like MFS transporter